MTTASHRLTIAMVAGETSGDLLGGALISAIKQQLLQQYPETMVEFIGIGGDKMQQQGLQSWYDMEELSVMGLVEVLKHLPRLLQIRRQLRQRLLASQPDIFIGIDAPDFNLTLEKQLKQQGIKTVHYVSPSVWAWRQKRVFKIAKATDLVLAFLPFEKAFYDRFNVPCRFIGHTLADKIPLVVDKQQSRKKLDLAENSPCLALLPGSRYNEVAMLSADFLLTAQRLKVNYPHLQVIAAFPNEGRQQQFLAIKEQVAADLSVKMVIGQAQSVMMASDAALLASGTVALECMLAKCPMVVAYRLQPFTYFLAKRLVKTPYVSLPNILSQKMLVPELLQEQCTVDNLVAALAPLLAETPQIDELKETFLQWHQQLRQDADKQAAKAVLELLGYE